MSKNQKKIRKCLDRPCPDCEERELRVVSKIEVRDDGVKITNKVIECSACGYEEPFHIPKKKMREELICRGKEMAPKKRNDRKPKVWSR